MKGSASSVASATLFSVICIVSAASAQASSANVAQELAGFSYIETLTGGADPDSRLPMLIALHYMSGSAATSIEDYADVDMPMRLLSLQGPYKFRAGFSWFPDAYYELDAASQLQITVDAADLVAEFISKAIQVYPTQGKPLMTGFSQGADLTHMVALRNPRLIAAALPMGGRFPDAWRDAVTDETEPVPQIVLFHGAADNTVDVNESLAAARYFIANGSSVVLRTYAGVGHAYPSRMKSDFEKVIERLIQ